MNLQSTSTRSTYFCFCIFYLIITFSLIGCSNTETHVTINGTVTYQDNPVSNATLTFYPSEGPPVVTTVADDGRYTCQLEPGSYKITAVLGVQLPPDWKRDDPIPPPKLILPPQYNSRVRTPLQCTVAADQSAPVDFVLK